MSCSEMFRKTCSKPDLDSYDLFHATHPDFGQGVQARTWRANRQD